MVVPSPSGRRVFIPIGISSPGIERFPPLEAVDEDIDKMTALFKTRLNYEVFSIKKNASHDLLTSILRESLGQKPLDWCDTAVLYYSGHGEAQNGSLYLVTPDYDASEPANALSVERLIRQLVDRKPRVGQLLVILDCCYSGEALDLQKLGNLEGLSLITACGRRQKTYDGSFRKAFLKAIENPKATWAYSLLKTAIKEELKRSGSERVDVDGLTTSQAEFNFFGGLFRERAPGIGPATRGPVYRPKPRSLVAALLGYFASLVLAILLLVLIVWRAGKDHHVLPQRILPADMAFIPGGDTALGLDHDTALAMYAQCQHEAPNDNEQQDRCGSDFGASVFARSVWRRTANVESFALDVHEVTVGEFAAWLNRTHAIFTRNPLAPTGGASHATGSRGEMLRDAGKRAISVVAIDEYPAESETLRMAGSEFAAPAGKERWPMTNVTWFAADGYCRAVGKRLPTELEWERAARGAAGRPFPWGADAPGSDGVAFRIAASTDSAPRPVGTSTEDRSPEGVMDLAGNVSEWTSSSFIPTTDDEHQLCGDVDCRVVRGGSYADSALWLHGALRSRFVASKLVFEVGFRCAMAVRP